MSTQLHICFESFSEKAPNTSSPPETLKDLNLIIYTKREIDPNNDMAFVVQAITVT